MTERKHALLIFSKPPIPGLVKTRMTTANGGIFTEDQAAEFFRRCLYDVSEMAMHALIELSRENEAARAADPTIDPIAYDFVVSTTPASSVELMRETYEALGEWPCPIKYLTDAGSTFDDHFDDAFRQLFEQGYESVVSIGADIPVMPKSHLIQAFQWLDYFQSIGKPGFVMAPCQECGTSLVGFSRDTPIDNQGIYYNRDGRAALDGYVEKLTGKDIPCAYLEPVADVDETVDLAHAISCMRAIKEAAAYQDLYVPERVLEWIDWMGVRVTTPPNEEHDPRQYLDGQEPEDIANAGADAADETTDAEAQTGNGSSAGPSARAQAGTHAAAFGAADATLDERDPLDPKQTAVLDDTAGTRKPSDADRRRISEGMGAIAQARAKTNAYEAEKYN